MEIKLKPETTKKINEIDNSIVYWSLQLGQMTMRLRETEVQVSNLYDFKKTLILEDMKAQEINIENCEIHTVDAETVVIEKVDSKEQKFKQVKLGG